MFKKIAVRLLQNKNFCKSQCCYLTSTEVATALRPFYFAVHPDLFGQYPNERLINENSLKQLSSFLETLQTKRIAVPCTLQFYIRDSKNNKGSFKLVKIYLKEKQLRDIVLNILKTCDLSTTYVNSIPVPVEYEPKFKQTRFEAKEFWHVRENDKETITLKRDIRDAQSSLGLEEWMRKHQADALDKTRQTMPVRDEVNKLKTILIERFGMIDIRWDCGWNETHFRGCLQSFLVLADHHSEDMDLLKDRVLVFAPFTGISLDGHVMLNSGEVRHNWLDLIKNISSHIAVLDRIPGFEKSVSQVLRNIKIGRRKFMPKILAGQYERNLQQITTSLCDFLSRRNFPNVWPHTLCHFELVVETESGPLMVSPTGQFIVPSTIPGVLLVNFITEHMKEAELLLEKYKKNKNVERTLVKECLTKLSLGNLSKDDNVNPDMMIACCRRLLLHKQKLQAIDGIFLNITTYYSVLNDGVVCIPWNWKL